jgi:hypothetical protein
MLIRIEVSWWGRRKGARNRALSEIRQFFPAEPARVAPDRGISSKTWRPPFRGRRAIDQHDRPG